jgi:predicted transcriptional regulator
MVTITMSPEALARLDVIAAERGQTRSAAVEALVRHARVRAEHWPLACAAEPRRPERDRF